MIGDAPAPPRVVAVVLAAGAASRFGSAKVLASLEGRPLLQHVLDRVASSGVGEVVVVLGVAADEVEAAIAWRSERRVRNPDPSRGLASSLQVGLASLSSDASAAVVVLGDQPRIRPEVIRAVIAAGNAEAALGPDAAVGRLGPVRPLGPVGSVGPLGREAPIGSVGPVGPVGPVGSVGPVGPRARPIVVARYAADGALNPVFLRRDVWPLAMALDGDRGMGPLIARSPELVAEVHVGGDNPDVDTPADLARLAGSTEEGAT